MLVLLLLSFIFEGCGFEIITVTSSNNHLINTQDSSIFISSVTDNRGMGPYVIGKISGAVTGKKETIELNDSLSVYIKKYFNSSSQTDFSHSANVLINSFSLTENFAHKDYYYLFGSLGFIYQNEEGRDSTITVNINANISRDKNKISEDIDFALTGCINQFIKNFRERQPQIINSAYSEQTPDSSIEQSQQTTYSAQQKADVEPEVRSAGLVPRSEFNSKKDSTNRRGKRTGNHVIYDEQVPVPEIHESSILRGAGFTYYSGDKITGGVQFDFRLGYQKPDWEYGFSIGFMYLTIKNLPYEGYLWALNLPFHAKYMLGDSYFSPYIGGTVRIIAGSADIRTDDQQDAFWGPTFEQYLGISVNRSIFIEAGVFQMFVFNSPLIPDDAGFRLSFHFLVGR